MVLKKILLNTALLCSSFLFCLFTSEILVRIFDPQKLIYYNNDLWIDDYTGLGHRHAPNLTTKINTGGAGLVNYKTDANGYRVNIDKVKPEKIDKNILILGDSYIEAIQVENNESIPELLKEKFYDREDLKISYDNTAVAAYNLNHYYLISKKQLSKNSYDLGIVFLSIANDIEPTQIKNRFPSWSYTHPHKFKVIKKINKDEIVNNILYPINDFFEVRSHLFLFFKYRLTNVLAKYGLTYSSLSYIFYTNEKNTIEIDNVMKLSNMIQDEFNKYDTPIFFVFLPTIYQVEEYTLDQFIRNENINIGEIDIELPNKLLGEKFYKSDIIYYDPLKHMKNITKTLRLYEPIDKHFNINGHEIISEYLYDKVKKILIRQL